MPNRGRPPTRRSLPSFKSDTDIQRSFTEGRTSPAAWRRDRLRSIGTNGSSHEANVDLDPAGESTSLTASVPNIASYGSLPTPRTSRKRFMTVSGLPRYSQSPAGLPHTGFASALASPTFQTSSFLKRTKTISTYDPAPSMFKGNEALLSALDEVPDTKLNGIRVWYSSFTSVDWLHDAIKESSRLWRLRSRKSFRGSVSSALDRCIDWVTVTIVGCLTAITAFFIIRLEQLLFDSKEGRCLDGWWLAERFCKRWQTWAELLDSRNEEASEGWGDFGIEYISYTIIALFLAWISCLLTIHLTASPTFVSDKDSGVLAPDFASTDESDSPKAVEPPSTKRKILYFAAGSGIPEIKTILSGFVIHGYLGGRTLFTKSVGLAFSVGSGLTLGKEGPFVHIACCIGNIVSRYFHKYETNEGKRREILSAAAAAGVAVAFGAPIGGVLFSLEEVSYYFPPKVMWQSFFCAMIAAITLRLLNPFGTGKLVLFQVTYGKDWHAHELLFFLILGVLGGVYGAYFSKLNYRWSRYVRGETWVKRHPVVEVLLVTLATSFLCFLNPYTRMGGTELVYNLFSECYEGKDIHAGLCPEDPLGAAGPLAKSIGVALLVKGALTIVTFGIKLPAGIFIPSLGVGACFGRIIGIGVQYMQKKHPHIPLVSFCEDGTDCVIPGLYAMVGAAATLSGVTRTTVSLAVIMFELTDTLTYAVPVMLAILVAKSVADAIEPKGIYDLVIELSQLPYLDNKRNYLWGHLTIADVIDKNVRVIRLDESNTVRELRDKLQASLAGYADGGFPILRPDLAGMKLVGYIGMNELEHALAVVADEPNESCIFRPVSTYAEPPSPLSTVSTLSAEVDPLNFSLYMDQAPLTVQTNSPLEFVQQLFAKLGAKYIIVNDPQGYYQGVIEKNAWIAFLNDLEEH